MGWLTLLRDGHINMNLSFFWEHNITCHQKLTMNFMSILPSIGPPFTSTELDILTHLKCYLNIVNCQNWGETPYQNIGFWDTLKDQWECESSCVFLVIKVDEPLTRHDIHVDHIPETSAPPRLPVENCCLWLLAKLQRTAHIKIDFN